MVIVLGDGNAAHRGKGHSLSFSKSTKPNDNMEVHPWTSVNDKEDLVAYEVSTGIMKKSVILPPLIDPVFVPFLWAVQKLFSVSIVPTAQGFLCTMREPAWSVRFVTLFE